MTEQPGGLALDLNCRLPAPRVRVFEALTKPDQLAKWWGPHGFTSPKIDFDPRVGGGYRITMQPPDAEVFHLSGEFTEVDPPTRLAYTFRWDEPDPDDQETVVTLTLRDLGDATELVLSQAPFATEGRRALHDQGWTDSFERLQELISAEA
jgi:uncharacterized protein YndB with AHSA1/START domain